MNFRYVQFFNEGEEVPPWLVSRASTGPRFAPGLFSMMAGMILITIVQEAMRDA